MPGTKRLIDREVTNTFTPHTLHNRFFICVEQFSCHHICPHPTRVPTKTAASCVILLHPRIGKQPIPGTTGFNLDVPNKGILLDSFQKCIFFIVGVVQRNVRGVCAITIDRGYSLRTHPTCLFLTLEETNEDAQITERESKGEIRLFSGALRGQTRQPRARYEKEKRPRPPHPPHHYSISPLRSSLHTSSTIICWHDLPAHPPQQK